MQHMEIMLMKWTAVYGGAPMFFPRFQCLLFPFEIRSLCALLFCNYVSYLIIILLQSTEHFSWAKSLGWFATEPSRMTISFGVCVQRSRHCAILSHFRFHQAVVLCEWTLPWQRMFWLENVIRQKMVVCQNTKWMRQPKQCRVQNTPLSFQAKSHFAHSKLIIAQRLSLKPVDRRQTTWSSPCIFGEHPIWVHWVLLSPILC